MQAIKQVPAAITSLITFIVLTIASAKGAGLSPEVASAISLVLVGIVSLLAPRASGFARPAGLTAAIVTVLVWFAPLIGIELTTEQALIIVNGLTSIVGLLTPRQLLEPPA